MKSYININFKLIAKSFIYKHMICYDRCREVTQLSEDKNNNNYPANNTY